MIIYQMIFWYYRTILGNRNYENHIINPINAGVDKSAWKLRWAGSIDPYENKTVYPSYLFGKLIDNSLRYITTWITTSPSANTVATNDNGKFSYSFQKLFLITQSFLRRLLSLIGRISRFPISEAVDSDFSSRYTMYVNRLIDNSVLITFQICYLVFCDQ